jgi:hypothetical protein
MTEERQWSEWENDFRAGGPSIRAEEIARRVRRSTFSIAAELAVTIVSFGVAAGLVHRMWTKPHPVVVIALAVFLIAVFAVCAIVFFRVQRGAWRSAEHTTRALLALLRRREEARLKGARFSMTLTLVVGVLFTLWVLWFLYASWDTNLREPWRAAIGIGGTYVLLPIALLSYRRWRRSRERALEKISEMERSFVEEENAG